MQGTIVTILVWRYRWNKNILETRLHPTGAKLNSGLIVLFYAYTFMPYIMHLGIAEQGTKN